MTSQQVRLGVFSRPLLVDLAEETGRLAEASLTVSREPVSSSKAQFAALDDGQLDAALTGPDNVLAYGLSAQNPLGRLVEVEVLGGVDRGLGLGLWRAPGDTSSLAGGRLGVDVAASGFALVAFALLEARGLGRQDYEVLEIGSTPRRARALVEGACDLTILNAGNELWAAARGATALASVEELGPYLGTVLVAPDPTPAVRTLATVLAGLATEVLEGRHDRTLAALAVRQLELDESGAAAHVAILRSERHGLIAGGQVDEASLDTVVGLRRRLAPTAALLGEADPARVLRPH